MVRIGYLPTGYYLVCLSIVFSFINWGGVDWLFPMIRFTLVQVLVVCIQVFGLFLCLLGYKKNEPMSFKLLINISLVLWGILVVNWAWFSYIDTLEWSRNPWTRSLTILDYLEYAAWALKGLLWVISGLAFMIADYIPKTRQAKIDNLGKNYTSDWVD